jgi:3-dehydroquinate dehydratase-2
MDIIIINGPNLNLLGKREPTVYGTVGFDEYFAELLSLFSHQCNLVYYQSNHEGDLIDKIHEAGYSCKGIVLNAGAYTHTSLALHDAIKSITAPVIEVHISNVHTREDIRRHSLIAPACKGSITGLGLESYRLAVEYLLRNS